jgi:hypothetical protein
VVLPARPCSFRVATRGRDLLQHIEAIERDLHRTFPTHALFASERGLTMLQSVLVA